MVPISVMTRGSGSTLAHTRLVVRTSSVPFAFWLTLLQTILHMSYIWLLTHFSVPSYETELMVFVHLMTSIQLHQNMNHVILFQVCTTYVLCIIPLSDTGMENKDRYRIKRRNDPSILSDLCPPGTYKGQDCNGDKVPTCHPCPEGSFNSQPNNADQCQKCRAVCFDNIHAKVTANCTLLNDLQCTCSEGFFSEHQEQNCYPHLKCPPGEGVLERGTVFGCVYFSMLLKCNFYL